MLNEFTVIYLHNDQKEQEKAKLGSGISFEYSVKAKDSYEAKSKAFLLFQSENPDLNINDYSQGVSEYRG